MDDAGDKLVKALGDLFVMFLDIDRPLEIEALVDIRFDIADALEKLEKRDG